MSESTAPEFVRFIDAERRAKRLPQAARRPMADGDVFDPVVIDRRQSTALVRVAARRAAGFFRPTKRTEVIWTQGGNELAVGFAGVDAAFGEGTVRIAIPVRCDQSGEARVEVLFVTGFAGETTEGFIFNGHHVLRKPFTLNALERAIAEALSRRRATSPHGIAAE